MGTPVPGSGAGLVGLAERTRLLGGTLTSGAEPDGGWAVRAWVPWGAAGADAQAEADPIAEPDPLSAEAHPA
jgi:hypothetical protein